MTQIMMTVVCYVTSGVGLTEFEAVWFLLGRVYHRGICHHRTLAADVKYIYLVQHYICVLWNDSVIQWPPVGLSFACEWRLVVAVIFKVVQNLNTLVTQGTILFITCLRTQNLVFQTTHMQHMVLCTGLSGVPDICSMFQTCGCSANIPIPSGKSTSAGPASWLQRLMGLCVSHLEVWRDAGFLQRACSISTARHS
jgi:hypothetical protein